MTEMASSGSGSQFLLRREGREDSEGEGWKRVFLTGDVEANVMRSAGRCLRVEAGSLMWRLCVHAGRDREAHTCAGSSSWE